MKTRLISLGVLSQRMGSEMSEKHIRSVLNQSLMASGEKEKLLDLLKVKLIECGWRNEMKQLCRECLKRDKSKANVEELIEELTPKARASVPDEVKKELLVRLRTFVDNNSDQFLSDS